MTTKKRCEFHFDPESQCKSRVHIVGLCGRCNAGFCNDHRLPEYHNCFDIEGCRQQAFNENKTKLESEQTAVSKIAAM